MDHSLPEAALSIIDWGRLKSGDADEGARLLAACDDQGFFYLNLSSEPVFLQDHKSVLRFMDEYFHQGLPEKMKDDRQSDTHGYEPVGTSTGAMKTLPDYYESLKASRDELHGDGMDLPSAIRNRQDLLLRFCDIMNQVVIIILQELERQLGLGDERVSFQDFHCEDAESLTTLSMFRYPQQETLNLGVGHNKHTDIGTLTFLLCEQWGLQVLSKEQAGWRFVAPREGHAVINVGDTLRFLSGNRFRSAVHRVIPTQRLQHEDRYSIAYFLRAANNTQFTDSAGRQVSAKQWHDEKFDVFRETHEEQEKLPILTGGMERLGSIVV